MKGKISSTAAALGASLFIGLIASPAHATGPEYWIDESTDFTGNGCENTDLNDVTSSLRSRLSSDGWTGVRWTNANAWPEDFIEGDFGGIDGVAADTRTLAVYAGHGNRALLQFGTRRNGRCTITMDGNARLGSRQGDDAAFMMYVTSCTLNTDSLSRLWGQQIRQQFGYHNSPSVKDNQPRDFYEETDSKTNAQAWIDEMEDRPGWFTGDNSPIVLTLGTSASNCSWGQNTARLRDERLLYDMPTPIRNWCTIMYDNGENGC